MGIVHGYSKRTANGRYAVCIFADEMVQGSKDRTEF